MSIRVEIADAADQKFSEEVALPELVNAMVDDVIAQKPRPTKENISDYLKEAAGNKAPEFVSRVGNTPLVPVPSPNPNVKIFAKAEFVNPTGSIKDRIAEHMFNQAEKEGKLKKGDTVVAASSGNTASAVAMLCSVRGYKCKIFTNTKCSEEKVNAVRAYGGEIIVGPSGKPADHPEHYQNLAVTAAKEPNTWDVDQYDNMNNPEAYYRSLAPEIWRQTNGEVTHFVAAGSTGGTVTGISRFLKEQNPDVKCILADPHGSCFTDYYKDGKHDGAASFLVEGVGKDSIPGAMKFDNIDYAIRISDAQAIKVCHELSQNQGMLVGGSSGLNIAAAQEIAKTLDSGVIVTVCPDTGLKYLSKYYNAEWLEKNGVHLDEERYLTCKRYKEPVILGPDLKHASLRK